MFFYSLLSYELVCLYGNICVSSKRINNGVWLPIESNIQIVGPTIYLRQDLDYKKTVFYCFLQVYPQVELSRDLKGFENLPKHPLLFSLLVCFLIHNHFSSINPNYAQQLYSKPLLLHNP